QNTADMVAACAEADSAAHLCARLVVNGVGGWFLPSRDELVLMYRNLKAAGTGNFQDRGLARHRSYRAPAQPTAGHARPIRLPPLVRSGPSPRRRATWPVHTACPAPAGRQGDKKFFPRRVRAIRIV